MKPIEEYNPIPPKNPVLEFNGVPLELAPSAFKFTENKSIKDFSFIPQEGFTYQDMAIVFEAIGVTFHMGPEAVDKLDKLNLMRHFKAK